MYWLGIWKHKFVITILHNILQDNLLYIYVLKYLHKINQGIFLHITTLYNHHNILRLYRFLHNPMLSDLRMYFLDMKNYKFLKFNQADSLQGIEIHRDYFIFIR